ncbi:thermonuclease family protein [soil metagenome]
MKLAALALVGTVAACGGETVSECGPNEATVTRVIDGDTVELDTGVKIRYLLINAPETTNGHNDCYGSNAAQFNTDLVLDKKVELDYDVQCQDMYGRTLAYVKVDGQEVNTLMLERGYACLLHISPDGDDRLDEFKALQQQAKDAKRGLWGQCDPIPCN